jgi:hypothetical protein
VVSTHLSGLIDIKRLRQGESNEPSRGCDQELRAGDAAVVENTVTPHRNTYNTIDWFNNRECSPPRATTQDKEAKVLKVVEGWHEGAQASGKWNM